MSVDIAVPELGESMTEATVARWLKSPGDAVARDEPVVELETDKANIEIAASASGVLAEILAEDGRDVAVGAVLGRIEEGAAPAAAPPPADAAPDDAEAEAPPLSPAVRRLVAEHELDPAALEGSGKGGRILKGDVLDALRAQPPAAPAPAPEAPPEAREPAPPAGERRVPMSRLRKAVARRLKQAQETAAMHHHLQRGGHDRGDGGPRPLPRGVRGEARRAAGLHVLLRKGGDDGAPRTAGAQCAHRRR